MIPETKPWWASKTIWGGLIAVASAIAGLFGFDFGADLQQQTLDLLTQAFALIGGLLAIWGRVVAKTPIGAQPDPSHDF